MYTHIISIIVMKNANKEFYMYVQVDILEQVLKDKDMSQAQLAKKSGVTETTISNWKKGKEARKSNVERVAKALGISVAKLTGTGQSEKKIFVDYDQVLLELVSHHYGVSADTIVKLAPILFSVIARRALNKRLVNIEDWYKKLQEAATPPAGVKHFHNHYDNVEHQVSYSSFGDTYYEERDRRLSGDLSVDAYKHWVNWKEREFNLCNVSDLPKGAYGTDLFFEELFEIDTGDAISDYDQTLANLKNYDEGYDHYFCNDGHDIPTSICAVQNCDFGSKQEEDAESAATYLRDGDVRISQIPTGLFKKGKEQELWNWINNKGRAFAEERHERILKFQASEALNGESNA